MNKEKFIAKEMEKHWKESIVSKLNNIEDIDVLESIDEFIGECEPITLEEYINIHFDECHKNVREALEHEVRGICLYVFDKFEPQDAYINHFSEMYVEDYPLDIWIHENGSLFNPCEIATIIFKLWTKEIVFQ